MQTIKIVKKDNTIEEFKKDKLFNAVKKSSERVLVEFTEEQLKELENGVKVVIEERFNGTIWKECPIRTAERHHRDQRLRWKRRELG